MTHYLLDTNHLSPIVTTTHQLRHRIIERQQKGDTFAIPAPVLSEFLYGIYLLPRRKENQQIWESAAKDFIYYSIDRSDAEQAADLRLFLRKKGRQLTLPDAFIAVVALRYNLVLLTEDRDFAPVPNLAHESWW